MKLTDFLGQEYGPGDLVIYGAMSRRSVNVVVGRVTDIYEVYRDHDSYKWTRLGGGELPPFKLKYSWFDDQGNRVEDRPKSGGEWRAYDSDEREESHTRVTVQPLRGARWKQHYGHDYYVDTRSGKRIDPWKTNHEHILSGGHYKDTRTGKRIPDEALYDHRHPEYVPYEHRQHVSVEFQSWVERRNDGPKPVTITVIENIIKWNGELSDGEEG